MRSRLRFVPHVKLLMMRNLKKVFLTSFMLFIAIAINAQHKNAYDWTRVINAIAQVESGGNPKAHNPNGDCAGLLQIKRCLVQECNNILKRQKSTKRFTISDRYNAEKSKEMFILIQEHYNKEHSIEKAIRCWNGGFYLEKKVGRKCFVQKTEKYYRKVMAHYR